LLAANQTVWLEVDGVRAIAKVIWREHGSADCQFEIALGEATYAMIISASPGPERVGDEIYI